MSDAIFLIVKAQTGVFYSNQTSGTACLHPEQEGFLVPGPEPEVQSPIIGELLAHFEGPPYDGCGCHRARGIQGVSLATADWLDKLFGRVRDWPPLRVDRAKLHECDEAWIHVLGEPYPEQDQWQDSLLGGEDGRFEGIVTWPNSD